MAIDYLPEQDVTQRQYFTGIGEYTPQYQSSNVNAIYSKIINQKKVRPAWELNSYQSGYDSFDTGIENYTSFDKRDGFTECGTGGESVILDEILYEGNRWYLVASPNLKTAWLEVECDSSITTDKCDQYLKNSCASRKKVCRHKIQPTQDTRVPSIEDACIDCSVGEYTFNPCVGQKFASTFGPKGNPLAFVKAKIRHDLDGNVVVASIKSGITVPIGARAYMAYSSNTNIVTWYMRQVKGTYRYSDGSTGVLLEGNHFGLSVGVASSKTQTTEVDGVTTSSTVTSVTLADGQTYVEEGDVEIWFFPERGNTISFCTANGVVQVHAGNCDGYYSTLYSATHTFRPDAANFNTCVYGKGTNITSFFTFAGKNGFMQDGGMYLAEGANEFWVFTGAAIDLSEEYNDFVEVGQYGYLLWPTSMAILYRAFTNTGELIYQLVTTDNGLGYFNRYSYVKHRGGFYITISDDEGMPITAALYVNPYDRGGGLFSFDIGYSPISKWWTNQEYKMINKTRGDNITMSTRSWEILIFATSGRRPLTKVIIYDVDDKFWHVRNICGRCIKFYKDGVWFSQGVHKNVGTTDWWEWITGVKGFIFGQSSIFSPKMITGMYFNINYESLITDKSWIRISMDLDGYERNKWMPIRWATYLENLNSLRGTGQSNEKDREATVFANMPLDLQLMAGNGIGKSKDKELELFDDLDTFCSYTYTGIKECIADCLGENTAKNNILDAEDNNLFRVSKFGTLYMHIGDQANKIYIEFVDEGTDHISLNGYELMWQFIQRDNLVNAQNNITTNNMLRPKCST